MRTDSTRTDHELPARQEATRARCYHWSRHFVEFRKSDLDQSIASRFEQQVQRYPDRIAAKSRRYELTYYELNLLANRIAHAILAQSGSERESIALLLETDVPVIASILGVLKAGKFYVTLDPLFPQARTAYMLEDSQAGLIITNSEHVALARELARNEHLVISIDEIDPSLPSQNPGLAVQPDDLAYVVYTSGSTGQPKGIVYDHRSVLLGIRNYTNAFHICMYDRLTLLHSSSFSSAMVDIFCALLNGAAVHAWDVKREGMDGLADWLDQEEITILDWVPTPFRYFIETLTEKSQFPRLRLLVLASEPVYKRVVDLYKAHFSRDTIFVNRLGTTETYNYRLYFLDHESQLSDSIVPAGYAVPDKQVLLLDDTGQEVEVNQVGEIAIKSRYLAVGYWRKPELTKAAFQPGPSGEDERVYRTGDVGVLRPDGCLEYLGRKDFQVKLRGYRVEVSEIEMALIELDAVKEAVVVAKEDEAGEKRLVAYVVPAAEPIPTVGELRETLCQTLPDYMIPSAFVNLDALPLTPTGKVDRRALPDPSRTQADLELSYIAPRTPVEEVLAGIWAQILGVERVGIHDSFFALGGHSLLGAQVMSRVRDALQVELPLRSLFDAPTVAGLAESIETALAGTAVTACSIRRASRDRPLPLTSAQERFWFLDQLEPGNPAYNVSKAISLSGPLDLAALERALNEIVRRHESLRTNFVMVDGQPVQVISPNLNLQLPIVDLQGLPKAKQDAQVQQLINQEARRPFNLERDSLLRTNLIRLGAEQHVLSFCVHHIVSDGWSLRVLYRELSALYGAFYRGELSPLSELPIQYADFAIWQRQWLQGEVRQSHLAYWKRQLGGSLPVLELRTDHPRPAVQTYRGAGESLVLSDHLPGALKALSDQEGATLFMTLLAAFNVLLYRYSGQEDIILGSPIAGRDLIEVEGLIGFFLNTLILRTDLSGNPTFRRLLQQVSETVLEAYAHQVIPFEELLSDLQPERSLSHTPLFQVLFVLHDPSAPHLEFPDLTTDLLDVESGTAMLDLSLVVKHTRQGLLAELRYSTDLFEAATITRMLGHFQALLEGIIDDPTQPISQLPLLTEVERHRMVADWNNTQVDFPKHLCFPGLFEEQVERTPDSIAVTCAGAQLSYRQLNARANHLARALIENGVGPDLVVAVLEERGSDLLVALIAILKAGGVYLPLDPRHPPERHRRVLIQSKASLILTSGRSVPALSEAIGLLPPEARPEILELEQFAHEEVEIENQSRGTSPADLAYVIYTSGSTGLPKGAMVEHRGMRNHLYAKIRDLDLTDADVVAQNASQTFDISVWQFLAALLVGGRVCIFPDEVAHDPRRMLQHVESEQISILETVPSLLRLMLEEVAHRGTARLDLSALRWLIPTGEALPPELCRQWLSHYPNIPLLNAYGPTECSDDVTHFPIYQPLAKSVVNMPIGRPIANMRMYVLDRQLQPVPVGIAGELYVGGIGVGRGYLHDPERTAEVFLPDPFAQEPGARLYRTGDLVRYLPDGTIQFLGRLDHQVKIRGFRIELGEIEVVLGKHPDVREVVVLAREDVPGDKRIVAYVVPERQRAPTSSGLRSFLQEKLPDYMVPAVFVRLEALPLTTSGKVDRRALPVPDRDRRVTEDTFMTPRDQLEFLLVDAWEQVLGMRPIGLRDNFFDMGGHSLLAVRLCAQIEKIVGERLPLATIFQAPTIEQLAILLRQGGWSAPSSPVVMIQPGDSRPPFFCLPGNLGNVFADLGDLARHLGEDQPVYGLQDGLQTPVRIDKLAAHFIDQMRAVQPEGPYFLGGICSGGVVAFEMAQQLRACGQQVALLALVEPTSPGRPGFRVSFRFSASISRRLVRRFGPQARRISQLSSPERAAYLRLKAKVLANAWATSRYAPQPYPGKIHLFLVRESFESPEPPKLRWCEVAVDGTEVYEIPGTHETIVGANDTRVEEAHMKALAGKLRVCMDQACQREGRRNDNEPVERR